MPTNHFAVTTLDRRLRDCLWHRRRIRFLAIPLTLLALCLAGAPAPAWAAAPECLPRNSCMEPRKDRKKGAELFRPYEIRSENGVLATELSVKYFTDVAVGNQVLDGLRMFGYPNPGGNSRYACEGAYCYTLPGPIYRVKKGDTFKLTLKNQLTDAPYSPHDACNPDNQHNDEFPNCFHGNNVTNFHFHGFHISPMPPHDNIFLTLPPGEEYALTSGVIPPNQAEGTHWYHPHHHGATALQVINGMASAFIVEGEFDEWLAGYYPNGLEEKVLVFQEVNDVIPFPDNTRNTKVQFVINGQLNPDLPIGDGEIERWRLINATATKSSNAKFTFPEDVVIKQIAMDGVQFAPANYADQPLLIEEKVDPDCDDEVEECEIRQNIVLAPGNRADFLVKGTGRRKAKARVASVDLSGFAAEARAKIAKAARRPLFSIIRDRAYTAGDMEFPPVDQWPALPGYLGNIEKADVDKERTVKYSMTGSRGSNPTIEFFIDDRQFDGRCVDQRMALDTAEEWTFENLPTGNTRIAHPAHIHVNPFQVWVRDGEDHPNAFPIWQDTIALPTDESLETVIRHRFENFEGMFVMHCHILGHEDRGMMQTLEIGDQSGCPTCPGEEDPQCAEYRRKLAAGEVP